MFVDERIYTLHAGKVPVFLKHYEEEGMPVQSRILGRMVGYYFTEFGTLNQIVHQWAYVSMEDRLARRKLLLASEDWQNYAKKMQPLVAHVENKMLMPAPFFCRDAAEAVGDGFHCVGACCGRIGKAVDLSVRRIRHEDESVVEPADHALHQGCIGCDGQRSWVHREELGGVPMLQFHQEPAKKTMAALRERQGVGQAGQPIEHHSSNLQFIRRVVLGRAPANRLRSPGFQASPERFRWAGFQASGRTAIRAT
ncbi:MULTISPECIES: NIPSNAP family protein [unclassified Variovorax]|uniref:NIPSNAP family protein n=1 Tax=unclassified Variovorax TaxID=663243 RepID=UPI0009FC9E95|nr:MULTISPECIES: NIPSNAP family protein [unclassified Variovorax]PNG58835.1 hypothetical protein CHC07_00560 [Variovorax sp. B4]PNG61375.1 hypothetical protein CHC06_01276 [Variovorax sp. B2]VTV12625.1 hypothetical protein WDL1CHR_03389 [Variovorax sp. WDL1]